jgi:demethylmenaquinone methyltransferase/2-methoxy-6-polyprenyl-1,4-benzoquinol methylase
MQFEEGEFDGVFISFGIRNFTNIETSLIKIKNSLKDGGGLFCLEFFPDVSKFALFDKIYKQYLLKVIPKIGKIIVKDEGSYKYFGESILNFYSKKDFKNLLQKQNFRFFSSNEGFLEIVSFFHFKK